MEKENYLIRRSFGNEEHFFIHKTITASIIDGFSILLEYTKRFRPFHLVLFRVKSEKKNYILTLQRHFKNDNKIKKKEKLQ